MVKNEISEKLYLYKPKTGINLVPVLISVPHTGRYIPPEAEENLLLSPEELHWESDLMALELWEQAVKSGALLVTTDYSRWYIDVNRVEQQVDGESVKGRSGSQYPKGAIWRQTSDSVPILKQPLTEAEYQKRLDTILRPYHNLLRAQLLSLRQQFGFAVLIDAHCFTAHPKLTSPDRACQERRADYQRPEIVLGTAYGTTASPRLTQVAVKLYSSVGYAISCEFPYSGGAITVVMGKPKQGIHSMQIEINRGIFSPDKPPLKINQEKFNFLQEINTELVRHLAKTDLRTYW